MKRGRVHQGDTSDGDAIRVAEVDQSNPELPSLGGTIRSERDLVGRAFESGDKLRRLAVDDAGPSHPR